MPRQLGITTLINAASADETIGTISCDGNVSNLRFDIIGVGTTSSGVITLACAHDKTYAGTWSTLTTVNASDVSGGAVKSVFAQGCFDAIQARISTIIGGGGTITVIVTGN